MPTTQKSPQKQTKATQKVGGSAKKPVRKDMEGGKAAPSKGKTARCGSARGGSLYNYEETKKRSIENQERINILDNYLNEIHQIITDFYTVDTLPQEFRDKLNTKLADAISRKTNSERELPLPQYHSRW